MCSGIGKRKGESGVCEAKGDPLGWSVMNLKHTARVKDEDILYASFISEVSLFAYFICPYLVCCV